MLDQEPINITHPNVFWVNQNNAKQALSGAYALFKEAITKDANFLLWGEFTGMTFMDSKDWVVNYIEADGNYDLPYKPASKDWTAFFRAANWASTIESYVTDMPDNLFDSKTEKNRIIGEAAFIKAISYFWMARVWGDAPIIKDNIENIQQLVNEDGYILRTPKSNELKVLDYALESVNKSISLLEYGSPADPTWAIMANKASAQALKAHITLWYASRDNDNADMINQSIAATTAVINNSNAELIDYVAEGKTGFDAMCIGQSKTGLFEINISSNLNESYTVAGFTGGIAGTPTTLTLNKPILKTSNTSAPALAENSYGKLFMAKADRDTDVRKELFFKDFDDVNFGFPLKYSHTSEDSNSIDPFALFSESNILIFRLADMYLLRAEANAKLGNGAMSLPDLNLIKSKAGATAYTGPTDRESLIKEIFNERAIEFIAEG
ncbi:MAG: RagB/SusD family nutrient uptake outer membrane protein, partial [Polaribacter sp.]